LRSRLDERASRARPPADRAGAATRDRIALAAAELMYVTGVHATTLDDIRAATSVS